MSKHCVRPVPALAVVAAAGPALVSAQTAAPERALRVPEDAPPAESPSVDDGRSGQLTVLEVAR